MKRKSIDLWILGIGIRGVSQITAETLDVLQRCRKVFDLTHQYRRVKRLNPNTVNLERAYWTGEDREQVYDRLVATVVDEISNGPGVALVSYGHPMIFDDVTLELVRQSSEGRFTCRVLPAVSCLDTLCIDLGIDYGLGVQIFETTDLVERRLPLNPRVDALLLQIGFFNALTAEEPAARRGRFAPLVKYLTKFYAPDHKVTIVFSEDREVGAGDRIRTSLHALDSRRRHIVSGSTLYIPAFEA